MARLCTISRATRGSVCTDVDGGSGGAPLCTRSRATRGSACTDVEWAAWPLGRVADCGKAGLRRYAGRMSERTRNLPRRSCLSIPGSSEKMLGKGPTLGADMVFCDLEDAVAPLEKEAARAKVVDAIKNQDWGETVLCGR